MKTQAMNGAEPDAIAGRGGEHRSARQRGSGALAGLGLRAKFLVAVALVAGMTLLLALVTWSSYAQVEEHLESVTEQGRANQAALHLSEAAAGLAATIPQLELAASHPQREAVLSELQTHSRALDTAVALIDKEGARLPGVADLQGATKDIGIRLIRLNSLIERRLALESAIAQRNLAAKLLNIDVQNLRTRDGGWPVLERVVQLFYNAALAQDIDTLDGLQKAFLDLAEAPELKDPRVADLQSRAMTLGQGPGSLFTLYRSRLNARTDAAAVSSRIRRHAAAMASGARAVITKTEQQSIVSGAAAVESLSEARRGILIIAFVTFVGPVLFVWMYLGHNIVIRLSALGKAMHRLAEGDLDTPIPRSGGDEIARMADELLTFRAALGRLRATTEEVKASEERLEAILDSSPSPLLISRRSDGLLLYTNARWRELFAVGEDDISGQSFRRCFIDSLDRERLIEGLGQSIPQGEMETRMRTWDGREFWARLAARSIVFDGQNAVFVSIEDVTRRKSEEQALETAKVSAEDANRAKSQFLATMSHEIRTPMNGVMSMADLLRQSPLNDDQKEMVAVIRDSSSALLTILDDILDFSKIEAGRLELERVDFPLAAMVEAIAELLAPRAAEKGLELVVYLDPALPSHVFGDPTRMRQVLLNLAGNAVKFTDKGHVHIEVTITGSDEDRNQFLHFEVRDTGIGLSKAQQKLLFEPFSQADASTARQFGGTGLGLSICRRLVDLMAGRIGVSSAVREGATFWFEVALEPGPSLPDDRTELAGLSILVAGDSLMGREVTRRYLAHGGATTGICDGGGPAIEFIRRAQDNGKPFDLVLFDCPGDGRPQFNIARQTAALPKAPHVALMGVPSLFSVPRSELKSAGMGAPIVKPVNRRALVDTVRRLCGLISTVEPVADSALAKPARFRPPTVDDATQSGVLVLVVEDNATNRLVIGKIMEKLGFAVEMAVNGQDAWDKLQHNSAAYGLVLTDCHMPEMDGYELAATIRAWEEGGAGRLPIIALTADALTGTGQRCRNAGMDDYLTKPVDIGALDQCIRRWLPRAAGLRLAIGDDLSVPGSAVKATGKGTGKGATEYGMAPLIPLPPSHGIDLALGPADPSGLGDGIFDPAMLTSLFGGIDDEAIKMLDYFLANVGPLLSNVETLLAIGDLSEAREAAHAAKGSSNMVGAYRLGEICRDIQEALEGQEALDGGGAEKVQGLLPDMNGAFVEFQLLVEALRAKSQSSA